MQLRASIRTQTDNIASIGGNLGLIQNDMNYIIH